MNKKDLAIATISWARDPGEEKLLTSSLTLLAKLAIPVFITDGGSSPVFINFMKSFSHFTVLQSNEKGVFAQAKTSLLAAYQTTAPFILYTEPDKQEFFQKGLPQMLDEVWLSDQSGIITASRSAAGFATFPSFQQMTETTINNCCTEITGNNFDYTYGPFLLKKQFIPYLNVKEDLGWGWRPYIFGIASRLGYKVEAYERDFCCPIDQRQDHHRERVYRMRQLQENIQGLVLSANTPLSGEQ